MTPPYTVERFDTEKEWLAARGMGGSGAATALGLNPHQSRVAMFSEMTGRTEPKIRSIPMAVGQRLEPLVLELTEEAVGRKLWRPPGYLLLRSCERPWQTYTPDAFRLRGQRSAINQAEGLAEAKAPGAFNAENYEDENSPGTVAAMLQLQHGLAVTGLGIGDLGVLIGNQEFKYYPVLRHERLIEYINEQEYDLWRCVETDTMPDPEAHPQASDALQDLLPYAQPIVWEVEDEKVAKKLERLAELSKIKSSTEKEQKILKGEVQAEALRAVELGEEADENVTIEILVPGVVRWRWSHSLVDEYTVRSFVRPNFRAVKL